MRPRPLLSWATIASLALSLVAPSAHAGTRGRIEIVHPREEADVARPGPAVAKTCNDTLWFVDWSFDAGEDCDGTGWEAFDNRIRNDGSHHWRVNDVYSGIGRIVGHAAVVTDHDPCWVYPDGYGSDWDDAVRITYRGVTAVSFDYLMDSERSYDLLTVEADSGCASHATVDYEVDPYDSAEQHRDVLYSDSGFRLQGRVDSLVLPDFGAPLDTHCVWLRFRSDAGYSQEDGLIPTTLAAALVIDNLRTWGGGISVDETFEAGLDPNVEFRDSGDVAAFGNWARLYKHVTDNDACVENWTCAWLWTDHTTPTLALTEAMAFGPGRYVVRNWLDNIVVSPWAALPSAPGATILSFERFPGNLMSGGRIVQNWDVRTMRRIENIDTPAPGDSIDCVSPWKRPNRWNSLSSFKWTTVIEDLSTYIEAESRAVQIRFRVSDYWLIAGGCDLCYGNPGPGPYIDRVRLGRRSLLGPAITAGADTRTQAQDAFPTRLAASSAGEHYLPSTDRFGTAAFSAGTDLGGGLTTTLVTADSITVSVADARGAGGISEVQLSAAIVTGPHAGKAPPPWSVGPSGFFEIPADSARTPAGDAIEGEWFVDLDDDYFRGGDMLVYVWTARDAAGGWSSLPPGLVGPPASIEDAQAATGGLFEVSFLPRIEWDPGYLARIAADPSGKLTPTPEELTNSAQSTCILYYQILNSGRRHGDAQRTSFMYTLDVLGYKNRYDVYDVQGYGNTNNQLGGRATVEQATGYAVLIQDTGRLASTTLPDGLDLETEKIDQAQWYRDWLAAAVASEAGTATLWMLGENLVQEKGANPLIAIDCGVVLAAPGQQTALEPTVAGLSAFTWALGGVTDFSSSAFALTSPCAAPRDWDALEGINGATVVQRFTAPGRVGEGATVVHADPAAAWNTLLMSFNWFDIADRRSESPGTPAHDLMQAILGGVLPSGCSASTPTAVSDPLVSIHTKLYAAVPNPFNPSTVIAFDIGRQGPVRVQIHDVAGRLVRTLVDGDRGPGHHRVAWPGLDEAGRRVASGVYFCTLHAGSASEVQRLVLLK